MRRHREVCGSACDPGKRPTEEALCTLLSFSSGVSNMLLGGVPGLVGNLFAASQRWCYLNASALDLHEDLPPVPVELGRCLF